MVEFPSDNHHISHKDFIVEAQKIYVSLSDAHDMSQTYFFLSDLMTVSTFIDQRPDNMSVLDAAKEYAYFKAGRQDKCWVCDISNNDYGLEYYA